MSTNLDEMSSTAQLWTESVENGGDGVLEDFMLTGNSLEDNMNENEAKRVPQKTPKGG